uniref:Centromere protein M n=1 Tax=Haemonchus contortus TaxID=6289 RepID=A0A7I5E9F4_HAECO
MDTVVELEQKRVCRVMSGKRGRFTVENLNHVRCALISDSENLGLLEKATTSAHYDEASKTMMARLTLNMKETQKKNSEANYLMDVVETYVDECDCINFNDTFNSPHVIIFALSTDDKSQALKRIEFVRRKIDSQEWICPVILLAYRSPDRGSTPYDVMKQLKELSRNSKVFRCMESTGLGRSLLRHCFAVALMAARPFLATTRAENDVCIDDGMEKRREKLPRKPNMEEKIPSIDILQNKSPFKKSCRIQ